MYKCWKCWRVQETPNHYESDCTGEFEWLRGRKEELFEQLSRDIQENTKAIKQIADLMSEYISFKRSQNNVYT